MKDIDFIKFQKKKTIKFGVLMTEKYKLQFFISGLKEKKNESSLCVLHLLLALPHGGMGLLQAGVRANTHKKLDNPRI